MQLGFSTKKHMSLLLAFLASTGMILYLFGTLFANVDNPDTVKSVSRSTAFPGETLRYTINISNSSAVSTTTTLTDTLPADLLYVTDSLTGTVSNSQVEVIGYGYNSGVITWTGILSGYGSASLTYEAVLTDTLVSGAVVTNSVDINYDGTAISRMAQTNIITSTNLYLPIISKSIPPPSLSVDRERGINAWTVGWSTSVSGVTGYELQESTSTDFTNATTRNFGSDETSFYKVGPATYVSYYCYRLRSYIDDSISGWSQTRCVSGDYYDEFSTTDSGWSIRRQDTDDVANYTAYDDDNLILKIGGRWDYAIASPLVPAPEPPYHIQTQVYFGGGVDNLHSYGLIFGGNYNGGACPNAAYSSCFNAYYRLNVIWSGPDNSLKYELKRIDGHDPTDNGGVGVTLIPFKTASVGDSQGYNTWAIDVYPNGRIEVYVEGKLVGAAKDSTYINQPYFGVFASSDEYAGSEPTFEYYGLSALPLP